MIAIKNMTLLFINIGDMTNALRGVKKSQLYQEIVDLIVI